MSHQEQPTTYTDWPGRNHGLFLHDGIYSELIDYPYYAGDEIHTNNVVFRNSSYVTYDNTHIRYLNKSDLHLYDTSGIRIYDSGTLTVYTSASPVARGFVVDSIGRVGIGMAHEQPHSNEIESPSFDLDVKGSVGVEHYIYHNDDIDTYILFGSDQTSHYNNRLGIPDMSTSVDYDEINIRTGGIDMLQMKFAADQSNMMINKYMSDVDFTVRTQTNSAALVIYGDGSEVVVNEDGLGDTDFRIQSNSSDRIFYVDTSLDYVEIKGADGDDSLIFDILGNSNTGSAGASLFRVSPVEVVVNESSNNVNFRVEADTTDPTQNTTDVGTDGGTQTHLTHDPAAALYVDGTTGRVGLGTSSPDTTLHIAGSAHIEGDLWVKGNTNQIDTFVHMTSAVDITNKGTGPALNVNQTGINPIATFRDDGRDILYIEDGGDVGFQTTNPHTSVYIEDSDGIRIPIGDTASRPLSGAFGINGDPASADFTAMYGTIRYNTEYQTFEGFGPGNAWGSLGGVIDIDRDTFWTALNDLSGSEYPGDPDTLRAYVGHDNNPNETNGLLMMTISANKTIIHRPDVGIGTMHPQGELHIKGGEEASRPVQLILEGPSQDFNSPFPQPMGQIAFTSSESAIDEQTGVAKIEARATRDFNPSNFGSEIGLFTTPYGGFMPMEVMTIKDTGQVGIGTIAPTQGAKLDVRGITKVGNSDNVTPDSRGIGHLTIDGAGYTGFISLDEERMWFGHNSSIRDITFATDETPRMTILAGGNVGIGTIAPEHKLKVMSNTGNYAGYFRNDATSGSGILAWLPNCTDTSKYVAYLEGSSTDLGLYVKSDGRVGIGTRSPGSDLTILAKNPSNSSTTSSPLTIYHPSNSVSMFLGDLNNTTGYSSSTHSGTIRFAGLESGWGDFSYYPTGGDQNEYGHFRFARSGSTVNTTPNAKVGVGDLFVNSKAGFGTTNPAARVEIQVPFEATLSDYMGNVADAGLLISSNYSNSTYVPGLTWQTDNNNSTKPKAGIWMYQDGGGSKIQFGTSGSYSSGITNTAMTIAPNGFVGINDTTPGFHLDVNGAVAIRDSNSLYFYTSIGSQRGRIFAKEGSPHLNIWTSGGEDISLGDGSNILFIDGSNNRVGINTTTPEYELDVRGNMRLGNGVLAEQDIYYYSANGRWQVGTNNAGNGTDSNQFYIYDSNYNPAIGHDGYSLSIQKRTGDVGIGTRTPGARLDVMGADGATTMIRVGKSTNGTQGTGVLELTQDGLAGGGIFYNGDLNPSFATGEIADYTCLYRMSSGVRHVVARWLHSSNQVTFTGDIEMKGGYLYSDGWFTNRQSMEGLYNSSTGSHFYAENGRFWNVAFNSNETSGGIRLRRGHNSQTLGYLYGDNDLDFGLLDAGGSWMLRHVNDSHTIISNGGTAHLTIGPNSVTGDYGTIQTHGEGKGSWEGYSINGRAVFMHNGANETGIYNDVDNEWFFKAFRNGSTYMYHNGNSRVGTTDTGAHIYGTGSGYGLTVGGTSGGKILLDGASSPYIRWREGSTDRAYIQWRATNNDLFIRNQETRDLTLRGNSGVNLRLEDNNGNYLGSYYGDSNKHTGLLDKDGNWQIKLEPDSATRFYINNSQACYITTAGLHFPAGKHISMSNCNITGVNQLTINDTREGISFGGGNGWHIYESPNSLSDAAGNIQIVQGSTRRATINTSGQIEVPRASGAPPFVVASTDKVDNLNADTVDGYHASQLINATGIYKSLSTNAAAGWYTIAYNNGDRATARFGLRDVQSGCHQSVVFYASHKFGNGNSITVLSNSVYSSHPIRHIRIKEGGTYDGAFLQVYVDQTNNDIDSYMLGDNFQSSGWTLCNWTADGSTPPGFTKTTSVLTNVAAQINLDNGLTGSLMTTGYVWSRGVNAGGASSQYRCLTTNDEVMKKDASNVFNENNASIYTRFEVNDGAQIASTGSSSRFPLEIYANNGTDAAICFHVGSDYAGYFGLDGANNDLYWGGWSVGSTTKYRIWHSGNDGSGSGLDADKLDGVSSGSFLRSDTSDTFTGSLTMGTQKALVANNYGRGVYGLYSSTRYQHVWSMGTSYNLADNGTGYGNLYGLSWTHTNIGTAANQSISGLSHQLQLRMNGTLHAAIGAGIWTSGDVTAFSDRAVKKDLQPITDAVNKVKQITGYTYERIDRVEDEENPEGEVRRQAGVVAQEVEKILPEVVRGEEGNKSVAYGNMVSLLVEAIKEQQQQIDDLKQQVEQLKQQ